MPDVVGKNGSHGSLLRMEPGKLMAQAVQSGLIQPAQMAFWIKQPDTVEPEVAGNQFESRFL
jgi:hypothetical protein